MICYVLSIFECSDTRIFAGEMGAGAPKRAELPSVLTLVRVCDTFNDLDWYLSLVCVILSYVLLIISRYSSIIINGNRYHRLVT